MYYYSLNISFLLCRLLDHIESNMILCTSLHAYLLISFYVLERLLWPSVRGGVSSGTVPGSNMPGTTEQSGLHSLPGMRFLLLLTNYIQKRSSSVILFILVKNQSLSENFMRYTNFHSLLSNLVFLQLKHPCYPCLLYVLLSGCLYVYVSLFQNNIATIVSLPLFKMQKVYIL